MELNFDEYERDLLIDTIQYRLESDEELILSESLKDELQDLLRKVEDDEYL
jgi:hypothetical protein